MTSHRSWPRLAAGARGEGLPPGFVPHTTYWLVSDGIVVGVANLRHSLTDALRREGGNIGYGVRPSARRRGFAHELLRRTLERARDLGLSEVLLTCDKTNIASVRTILKNGGVFVSEEFLPERGEVEQRYRIGLYPIETCTLACKTRRPCSHSCPSVKWCAAKE